MQFVIAALVSLLFLADWPPDSEKLPRQLYQVIAAFCLVGFVIGVAVLAFPLEQVPFRAFSGPQSDSANEDIARALRGRNILYAAMGVGIGLGGVILRETARTVSGGLLLASAVLLATTALFDTNSVNVLYDFTAGAGDERNALFAAILGAGSLTLLLYGYNEWDRQDEAPDEDNHDEEGDPQERSWSRVPPD